MKATVRGATMIVAPSFTARVRAMPPPLHRADRTGAGPALSAISPATVG